MAALVTASVAIQGYINFLSSGRLDISTQPVERPTTGLTTSANPVVVSLALASGNNTISFPSGMRGCVITLDPASTRTKILKGVAGDTGITISTTGRGGTFVLLIGSSVATSFVIDCSGADTGVLTHFNFF